MADDISQINAQLEAAQALTKQAASYAETFRKAATKATGEAAASYDKIGQIYEAITKNAKELEKIQSNLTENELKRRKVLKEIEKLEQEQTEAAQTQLKVKKDELTALNKDVDLQRKRNAEVSQALDNQKKVVSEISKAGGVMGKIFDSTKARLAATFLGMERLVKAGQEFSKAVRDVQDIGVLSGSFIAQTGDWTKDLGAATMAAGRYTLQLSKVQAELMFLGISAEEAHDSFKQFGRITSFMDPAKQSQQMGLLTTSVAALSKTLGVSLTEATDYVVNSQLKFGSTASSTAQALLHVRNSAEDVNRAVGKNVISTRDITKAMFDLARESGAAAQNQLLLSRTLTSGVTHLQAAGMTQEQATKAAISYTKTLTTEAPAAFRILSGMDLSKQMRNMTKATADELDRARPGLSKKIKEIMASQLAEPEKQRLLQKYLEGTTIGMDSMQKTVSKLLNQNKATALTFVKEVLGITDDIQAEAFIKQSELADKRMAMEKEFISLTKQLQSEDAQVRDKALKRLEKEYDLKGDTELRAMDLAKNREQLSSKISDKLMKQDADRIKAEEDAQKAVHEQTIANLKAEIAADKAGGRMGLAAQKEERLKKMTEAGLAEAGAEAGAKTKGGNIAATASDPLGAAAKLLDTGAGKLVVGATALIGAAADLKSIAGGLATAGGLMKGGGGGAGEGLLGGVAGKVAEKLGKVGKVGGKFLKGAGILGTVANLGMSAMDVYSAYSDKNATAEQKNKAVGGAVGGLGGAGVGALVGSMILPGVGTAIGSAVGSYYGEKWGRESGAAMTAPTPMPGATAVPTALPGATPGVTPSTTIGNQALNQAMQLNLKPVVSASGGFIEATSRLDLGSLVGQLNSLAQQFAPSR